MSTAVLSHSFDVRPLSQENLLFDLAGRRAEILSTWTDDATGAKERYVPLCPNAVGRNYNQFVAHCCRYHQVVALWQPVSIKRTLCPNTLKPVCGRRNDVNAGE